MRKISVIGKQHRKIIESSLQTRVPDYSKKITELVSRWRHYFEIAYFRQKYSTFPAIGNAAIAYHFLMGTPAVLFRLDFLLSPGHGRGDQAACGGGFGILTSGLVDQLSIGVFDLL